MKISSLIISLLACMLAAYATGNLPTQPVPAVAKAATPDLSVIIATAKTGQDIQLDAKTVYKPIAALSPTNTLVTIHCNGATIDLTNAHAKGGSSNFNINVAHFTVDGGHFTNPQLAVLSTSDSTTFSNCHFEKCSVTAIQTGIDTKSIDPKTKIASRRGTNFTLTNTRIEGSVKVGVYDDQGGFKATNCYVGPSDKEYAFRQEIAADNVIATGCILTGCTFDNPRTVTNGSKDCAGFRVGNCSCNWCTFHGDTREGQDPKTGPAPKPGQFCNVTFANCTIDKVNATINAIQIYQGSIVTTTNQTITALYAVTVGANSTFSADTTMHITPWPGPIKPLVSISSQGQHEELHTTSIMGPKP